MTAAEKKELGSPAGAIPFDASRALPPMAVKVQGKLYPVETYAEASEMVLAALAQYHGRFGDLPEIGFYEGGRKTGRISTNGKVWLRRGGQDYQVWPPRADFQPLAIVEGLQRYHAQSKRLGIG